MNCDHKGMEFQDWILTPSGSKMVRSRCQRCGYLIYDEEVAAAVEKFLTECEDIPE